MEWIKYQQLVSRDFVKHSGTCDKLPLANTEGKIFQIVTIRPDKSLSGVKYKSAK
jgi:hypothetical protein